LIVVIAIIAILASVSIVGYNQFIENARDSRAETELDVIVRQLEAEYYVDDYETDDYTVAYNPSEVAFTVTEITVDSVDSDEKLQDAIVAAINAAMDEDNDEVAVDYVDEDSIDANADPGELIIQLATSTIEYDENATEEFTLTYYAAGGTAELEVTINFVDYVAP